jgi:hypothetical protein
MPSKVIDDPFEEEPMTSAAPVVAAEPATTDRLVTVDQPWQVTLDLPDWTRRRDRLREVARPDR